jgi:hypothetical protein
MTNKTKRSKKPKKGAWFVSLRGSYIPVSSAGWWTYVPYVAYLALVFIYAVKDISSLAVKIVFIAVTWFAATLVMTYIASKKS